MRVRFVRHAQSAANAGERTLSNADIPLTGQGRQQARDFAASLVTAPDLILVSPFLRARDTARPVVERFPQTPVQVHAELHELTMLSPARYDGTTAAERAGAVNAYWERLAPDHRDGPDAESFTLFAQRVRRVLADIATLVHDDVLVVGHGQFMALARLLTLERCDVAADGLMGLFVASWRAAPIPNLGSFTLDLP